MTAHRSKANISFSKGGAPAPPKLAGLGLQTGSVETTICTVRLKRGQHHIPIGMFRAHTIVGIAIFEENGLSLVYLSEFCASPSLFEPLAGPGVLAPPGSPTRWQCYRTLGTPRHGIRRGEFSGWRVCPQQPAEKDTDRQTDRRTDRQRDRQRDRHTQRERETEREREREREVGMERRYLQIHKGRNLMFEPPSRMCLVLGLP